MSGSDIDVAIIGAGSAGIAAGRHVHALRPDLSTRLFEAGSRIGGRAQTIAAGPDRIPVDLGCGWLHGGRDNIWTVIASRTGFTLDRTPAPWDGGHRTIGPGPKEQAAAADAIAAFFARAEEPHAGPDVPLSAVLEPGQPWAGLLGAIGTFVNGVELDQASLIDYQRYAPGRGPDPRVKEGYGTLVQSYGAGLPVSLDTPVERIAHDGPRVIMSIPGGTVTARAVIVAVPSSVLAHEDLVFDPPLPDKVAAATGLPLGVANKLFLSVPAGVDLPAEEHLMGFDDCERTGGYHLRPFGRPVIEGYFGGQLARDIEREGLAGATDFARAELSRHFGADIAGRLEPLALSAWAATPLIHGSYSYARPGAADARGVLAEPVDERLFFAGEACSPHRFSTAHGAFETGVVAAEAAVAALSRAR